MYAKIQLKNQQKSQKPSETTCWPIENLKIWRLTEINVFHRGQSEMICGLTENLKLFREPTEMTYRSTETLKKYQKPNKQTTNS